MAAPKVFVSSTWDDLRYIRESLKFCSHSGYEPSSARRVAYFRPDLHVQEACLYEVPNSQIFVLIIGGRHGATYKGELTSITNHEFKEARARKVPVFALVEQNVLSDYNFHVANRDNPEFDAEKARYPSTDNSRIFDFIDEVQSGAVNNALVPFQNFDDIERYLRQQFAGMMFSFLSDRSERDPFPTPLKVLTDLGARLEVLSEQILSSVGTPAAKLTVLIHEKMLQTTCMRDIAYMGSRLPPHIVASDSFRSATEAVQEEFRHKANDWVVRRSKWFYLQRKVDYNSSEYKTLRAEILDILRSIHLHQAPLSHHQRPPWR